MLDAMINAKARGASVTRSARGGAGSSSRQKIIEGARAVIARQGARKLSMRDVAEAAGVAPGTLYRYFATKDDLLLAVSESISRAFEDGVVAVAAAHEDPVKRLEAVLRFHFTLTEETETIRIVEVEPAFVIDFLRAHFERHKAALGLALASTFDTIEKNAGTVLERDLLVEALLRMELSEVLVPGAMDWQRFPDLLTQMVARYLTSGKKARSRGASKGRSR